MIWAERYIAKKLNIRLRERKGATPSLCQSITGIHSVYAMEAKTRDSEDIANRQPASYRDMYRNNCIKILQQLRPGAERMVILSPVQKLIGAWYSV